MFCMNLILYSIIKNSFIYMKDASQDNSNATADLKNMSGDDLLMLAFNR